MTLGGEGVVAIAALDGAGQCNFGQSTTQQFCGSVESRSVFLELVHCSEVSATVSEPWRVFAMSLHPKSKRWTI